MEPILEARNITKKFSGVTALHDADLVLFEGKTTALIGENGAGKSTLLKIMSGIYTDYEGVITYKGKQVRFSKPKDAQDQGISIIHQELNLIPNLTVAQNIFLGREIINKAGFLDESLMHQKSVELLERLQLKVDPKARLNSLKVGQQQVVEIAKALLTESKVLFMDEPTSALGDSEVEVLFGIINQLKSEGKSIVYISHKLDELYKIADNFVVLRDGKIAGEGIMESVKRDDLINMMAGREIQVTKKHKKRGKGKTVLEVRNLGLSNPDNPHRPILQDINFTLNKGEVLGLYGLMGAGRTELFERLFGLHPDKCSGTIAINGTEMKFRSPIEAIRAGMALVPEDRKQDGIIPEMSVAENISLTAVEKVMRMGLLNNKAQTGLFRKHVESLNIKVAHESQLIKYLSGGNQQKVVLAKWIESQPQVLMLDEPTRGIDINAKNEIYDLIAQLADSGISIIIASSEIPEILAVSDRILVLSEGRITLDLSADEATENKIMNACIPEKITT